MHRGIEDIFTDWKPGADVRDHSGEPSDPQADFFARPPSEIGAVLSAHSTLRRGQQPRSAAFRLGLAAGLLGAGLGVGWYVAQHVYPREDATIPLAICGAIGAFLALIAWVTTGFVHVCSFVGRDGLARFMVRGRRDADPTAKTLHFADANELRTQQTRRYVNGVYTGTSYSYRWTDAAGKTVFNLSGTHKGGKKSPKPSDPFHFASSGEGAWSVFLLHRIAEELQATGGVRFSLTGADYVRVAPGFLELSVRGHTEQLPTAEIQSFTIADGMFRVKHKDARWLSSKGKFSFSYSSMANARLFLLVLDKLTGLGFGD